MEMSLSLEQCLCLYLNSWPWPFRRSPRLLPRWWVCGWVPALRVSGDLRGVPPALLPVLPSRGLHGPLLSAHSHHLNQMVPAGFFQWEVHPFLCVSIDHRIVRSRFLPLSHSYNMQHKVVLQGQYQTGQVQSLYLHGYFHMWFSWTCDISEHLTFLVGSYFASSVTRSRSDGAYQGTFCHTPCEYMGGPSTAKHLAVSGVRVGVCLTNIRKPVLLCQHGL